MEGHSLSGVSTSLVSVLGKIGKYELVRKLATGEMAEVFLARVRRARGLEKTVDWINDYARRR